MTIRMNSVILMPKMILQTRLFGQLAAVLFLVLVTFCFAGEKGGENSQTSSAQFCISGVPWTGQVWNNCGPANLAQVMRYWGWEGSQFDIQSVIRPNENDPHVGIDELAGFARSAGFHVFVLHFAGMHDLKTALSSGKPVIVPTWHVDGNGEQMGHYRTVYGYDDHAGGFFIRDTLEGPDVFMTYDDFECLWAVFNKQLLILSKEDASVPLMVSSLVSSLEMPNREQCTALELFSGGTAFLASGDFDRAVELFERSREQSLPWRIWWYRPEALEAYIELARFQQVLDITGKALRSYPYSEELYYWRARAFDALGDKERALDALSESHQLRPDWLNAALLQSFSIPVKEGFPGIGLKLD